MKILPTRFDLFRQMSPGTEGAEIGVFAGEFSAEILATPVAKLHLVDAWKHQGGAYETCPCNPSDEEHHKNKMRVLDRFKDYVLSGRVEVWQGMSVDIAEMFEPDSLDWVYLDADHAYGPVMADLVAWSARLKPGGWLCGHDYTDNPDAKAMGFGVVRAVNDFCEREGWGMIYLTDEKWASYALTKK